MQAFTKIIVLLALCALAFAEGDSIRGRQLKKGKDNKQARYLAEKSPKTAKSPKTNKTDRYLAEKSVKTAKSPKDPKKARDRQLKSVKTAKSPKDPKRARDRQLKDKAEKTPKGKKAE